MHPIEGAKKTPLNGCVRNNDAFSAGRAVAHLTHASSQKVGGRSGDILGRSGDALAHSGDTPGRSMTLQDAPGRSGTLQGRFGGHSGGLCGHFGDGWMMLMMVVAMVMAMAKIFAFRFYMSKLPINRVHGEGRRMSYYRRGQSLLFFFCHGRCLEDQTTSHIRSWKPFHEAASNH